MAAAVERLVLVEHPQHVLRRRHHVGRRHVLERPDFAGDLPDPAAADQFLLARAQVVRVADDPALGAAERDVDDGALPRHPHRQGADRVDAFLGVEADAAFGRAARVVVLDAEAPEDLHVPVVHADGNLELVFAQRLAQKIARARVEIEQGRHVIELLLRHLERVEAFRHVMHIRTSGYAYMPRIFVTVATRWIATM